MKRAIGIITAVCIALGALSLYACTKDESTHAMLAENCGIIHEPEFGGIYITKTIEEFDALDIEYGDSVNIEFSNGYKLEDLPYYNGYYVKTGEPLLIAYPGYDYIKAAINNGDDLWNVAGLEENMTASITLNEHGKYLSIQKARDIHYKDDRALYSSDEVFANFRAVESAKIKPLTLYRSASPCDNQHNRATYADSLISAAGVRYILNLSDNDAKIAGYLSADDFACPYFRQLYESGNVNPIALNMNYSSEEFREKIASGLTGMAEHEGPYLVHCTEGKDRTGFVCMLIEALIGMSYEEIERDYMITYSNYYNITKESDGERYDTIVENLLVPMIQSMAGDENLDVRNADLASCALAFLKDAGMSDDAIAALRANIQQ